MDFHGSSALVGFRLENCRREGLVAERFFLLGAVKVKPRFIRLPKKSCIFVTDNSSMAQRQNIVQVVRGYGKRLFGFIRQRVPNDADAEDVLQDVWFQLSQLVDLDSVENIGAWLFRVTRNKLTDRSRKRLPENLEDLAYEDEDGETHYAGDLLTGRFCHAGRRIPSRFILGHPLRCIGRTAGKPTQCLHWE